MPVFDQFKWIWPWSTFREPIRQLQVTSDAAAERLGIPVGRRLSDAELSAWRQAAPLSADLPYPMLGARLRVSVVNPWDRARLPSGQVWARWGGPGRPTFGPLDIRSMRILWASD